MDFKRLNNNNFEMYTMKMYTNPQCENMEEFQEDMNRIKYIKRLLGKYEKSGSLRTLLIMNHLKVINNVFGSEACCRILFYKIEENFHSYLKSFLSYLQYLPYDIPEVDLSKIPLDHKITLALGKMK
jgi:hypothetical protein